MRRLRPAIVIVIILIAAYLVFRPRAEIQAPAPVSDVESPAPIEQDALQLYTDEAHGFTFSYPGGSSGYVVRDAKLPTNAEKQVVLVHASDAASFDTPPAAGELPPVVSVSIYENTDKAFPRVWAESHAQESGYAIKTGDVEDLVVGGANAIRYETDGLYRAGVTVVAHGSRIYVIEAEYASESDANYRDYEPLLQSFTFIPAPGEL